jgi:hypothetical protein
MRFWEYPLSSLSVRIRFEYSIFLCCVYKLVCLEEELFNKDIYMNKKQVIKHTF